MTMDWRERIERDPATLHGEPHIRGTRIPVSAVVSNVAARADLREVLAGYPSLSEEDVRACVAYAAECSHAREGEPSRAKEGALERPAPPAGGAAAPREPMLYDLLMLGPNVGEDADFERRRHPPRELPEWDT